MHDWSPCPQADSLRPQLKRYSGAGFKWNCATLNDKLEQDDKTVPRFYEAYHDRLSGTWLVQAAHFLTTKMPL
jgi:hypothetical protein